MNQKNIKFLISRFEKIGYLPFKKQEERVKEILKEENVKFIYQPNGTQCYPDFILPEIGLDIECKSSMNRIPMWNCTYPKIGTMYIFSSKIDNKTIVFDGSELVTQEISEIYNDYIKKNKELHEMINQKLNKVTNPFNMKVYARNMFTQGVSFKTLSKKTKTKTGSEKNLGQFFTTDPELLESLIDGYTKVPDNVLEPSSGTGNILKLLETFSNIDAVEIAPELTKISKELFPNISHYCDDFLTKQFDKKYDLIIGNPPYFEMKKFLISDYFSEINSGRVNIYYLFIYKCIKLLNYNGELRFIIPRAFLSNKYALKCREFLLKNCNIIDICYFSDKKLFKNVLQSVIILKIEKVKDPENSKFVLNFGNNIIFVKNSNEIELSNVTIKSLGCSVKTGPIVWNQNKKFLTDTFDENSLELFYSSSITGIKQTNLEKKKFMMITEKNKNNIQTGECLVVQRIIGDSISCKILDPGKRFIENHVNIITGPSDKLKIIQKSLNSEKTISFVKNVIGNTQCSKNELENIIPIWI